MLRLLLTILLTALSPSDAILNGDPSGDFNRDGVVDGRDVQAYVDASTGRVVSMSSDTAMSTDLSGACVLDGDIFTIKQDGRVWRLHQERDGRWTSKTFQVPTAFCGTDLEAIASDGRDLYTLSEDTRRVARVSQTGAYQRSWVFPQMPPETDGAGPEGLAVLRRGDALTFYVAHQVSGYVWEFAFEDDTLTTYTTTRHAMPYGESCGLEIVGNTLYVLHGAGVNKVTAWEIQPGQLSRISGQFDCPLAAGVNVEGLSITPSGRVWTVDGAPFAGAWWQQTMGAN